MSRTTRPASDEYSSALAGYVGRVGDEDILVALADQLDQLLGRLGGLPASRGAYRYAPGKWTLTEILGHLADTERVFQYRALRIARGDTVAMHAFEDERWVEQQGAAAHSLEEMLHELADVRRSSLSLFRHLPDGAWTRRGVASGATISVRALPFVIVGHVRHHLEVVEARYLQPFPG
jgi:hypothetical protein